MEKMRAGSFAALVRSFSFALVWFRDAEPSARGVTFTKLCRASAHLPGWSSSAIADSGSVAAIFKYASERSPQAPGNPNINHD